MPNEPVARFYSNIVTERTADKVQVTLNSFIRSSCILICQMGSNMRKSVFGVSKRDLNQPPQLQRLARKLIFCLQQV